MDSVSIIEEKGRCGACGKPFLGDRLNLVTLDRKATWEYPTSGNVLTGESGRAVAILCDGCVEDKVAIQEAMELRDDGLVYHPLAELETLPPEKDYVLVG